MADSWEDWEEDELVNAVDTSKFADEDKTSSTGYVAPTTQVRKTPVESKYADKDREYAAKNLPVATTDDKAEIQAAQEAADLIAAQELFGSACTLATKTPKTNGEFEEYAQQLFEKYVLIHKNSKQWKFFIKSIVRQACEPFSKEEMKDIEAVVASVRSDKVKADIAAAKELRKGVKKNLKMESDDIAAVMDYSRVGKAVNNDDDFDFM